MHKTRLVIAAAITASFIPSVIIGAPAAKQTKPAAKTTPSAAKPAAKAATPKFDQEAEMKKFWAGPDSAVIATVNGENITKGELVKALWDWQAPAILEEIVNQKMISQAAKKAGVTISQADMDKKVAETKQRMPGEFSQVLRQYNLTKARFMAGTKVSLMAEKTVQKSIKTSDSQFAEYVKARHILVRFPQDEQDKAKAETQALEKAKKIYDELKAGKDFSAAAKEYSEDPSNKDKGGDLSWFQKGRMVKEFEDKAFTMKAGEMSEPVKTFYGYHIIKIDKIGKDATAADKVELANMIREQQMQPEMQKWYTSLKTGAKIDNKISPPLPAPAMPAGRPNGPAGGPPPSH